MRTSTTKHAVLTAGGTASAVILDCPAVLTTVIVQENSGTAYAIVELRKHGSATKIMVLSVRAGESAVWTSEAALGSGLDVVCTSGSVAVTIGYY